MLYSTLAMLSLSWNSITWPSLLPSSWMWQPRQAQTVSVFCRRSDLLGYGRRTLLVDHSMNWLLGIRRHGSSQSTTNFVIHAVATFPTWTAYHGQSSPILVVQKRTCRVLMMFALPWSHLDLSEHDFVVHTA